MRIITGDECGLLKEVIPELCRPLDALPGRSGSGPSSASTYSGIHAGRARPSATSIQAAASSYGNYGSAQGAGDGGSLSATAQQRAVQRLEPHAEAQARERGVVSLTSLPRDPNSARDDAEGESSFHFAVMRMNGFVETWSGDRVSGYDEQEVNVTAATYQKRGGLAKSILIQKDQKENASGAISSDIAINDAIGSGRSNGDVRGWYTHQPIRPIGMVSTVTSSSTTSTIDNNGNSRQVNPILATCDSIGNISLVNAHNISKGVVSRYNAFDLDANSALSPSSSKNAIGKGTLTHTKGRFANTSIASAMALCDNAGEASWLAVGGRERGVRILDLESGKLLWKAKNLPPDPQTLLQQPMWTTAIQFLDNNAISSGLMATGTAYKQVQIYDVRISSTTRRPVLYTPDQLLSHRITALCHLPDGNIVAAADSAGDCHLLDVRMMHSGKRFSAKLRKNKEEIGLGRLVGPGGSIRQLGMHPTLSCLACVGLDRKLWTWDVKRRKMTDCVYLKQRLNCLLFCEDGSWGGSSGDEEDNQNVDVPGSEGCTKREKNLEEDEVVDYVDSEDEERSVDAVKVETTGNGIDWMEGGTISEEAASHSEESNGDSTDEDLSDESTIDEKFDDSLTTTNPKKRQKK